jgi:hypothetical protein
MSIEFGILNFGVLMLVAYACKRDGKLGYSAAMGFCAYAVLAWSIAQWAWHLVRG